MSDELTRRRFLKAVAVGVVGAGATGLAATEAAPAIARRPLGKTGAAVSILGLGGGSNFLAAARDEDAALTILNACLDGGVNYFDTAFSYGRGASERYYSLLTRHPRTRARLFLATKTEARTYDAVMRGIEASLKNLRVDHVDLFQLHAITTEDTPKRLTGKQGAFTALLKLKEQKVVRFVGITGHASAVALRELVEKLDGLDTALFPVNAGRDERDLRAGRGAWKTPQPEDPHGHMEIDLLPLCRRKGVGVIAMKSTACGFLIGGGPGKAAASTLIRYTMSVPGVAATIVGPGSLENLRQNIALAQSFQPMGEEERRRLSARLTGALREVAYRQPGYRDGNLYG